MAERMVRMEVTEGIARLLAASEWELPLEVAHAAQQGLGEYAKPRKPFDVVVGLIAQEREKQVSEKAFTAEKDAKLDLGDWCDRLGDECEAIGREIIGASISNRKPDISAALVKVAAVAVAALEADLHRAAGHGSAEPHAKTTAHGGPACAGCGGTD